MAQQTNHFNVSVHGIAGTPNQDQDLADRMGKTLEQHAQKMMGEELRRQMKPGGVLYGAKRGNI